MENRDAELNRADLISEVFCLHGHIRYYMRNHESVFVTAEYQHPSEYCLKENPKGVTYNFPFCIMTLDNQRYPIGRSYRVIIFYPATAAVCENSPVLWPGEIPTDFITITIDYIKGGFEEAKIQAVNFIDSKIADVHANYKSDPNL